MRNTRKLAVAVAAVALVLSAVIPAQAQAFAKGGAQAVVKQTKQQRISSWFQNYDEIRRQAQMSPAEKCQAQNLMAQSVVAAFSQSAQSSNDKQAATSLLNRMVDRYQRALSQMQQLGPVPEAGKLHAGYTRYFRDAASLFSDYLKVQNNLFAVDASGNSILGQLQQRKTDLEALDAANKQLDAALRARYKIAPYAF